MPKYKMQKLEQAVMASIDADGSKDLINIKKIFFSTKTTDFVFELELVFTNIRDRILINANAITADDVAILNEFANSLIGLNVSGTIITDKTMERALNNLGLGPIFEFLNPSNRTKTNEQVWWEFRQFLEFKHFRYFGKDVYFKEMDNIKAITAGITTHYPNLTFDKFSKKFYKEGLKTIARKLEEEIKKFPKKYVSKSGIESEISFNNFFENNRFIFAKEIIKMRANIMDNFRCNLTSKDSIVQELIEGMDGVKEENFLHDYFKYLKPINETVEICKLLSCFTMDMRTADDEDERVKALENSPFFVILWILQYFEMVFENRVPDKMLLLISENEGIGKTMFFKKIIPNFFFQFFVKKNFNDKEFEKNALIAQYTSENVMLCLDEFRIRSNDDMLRFKAFMSDNKMVFDKKYKADLEVAYRSCLIGATSNSFVVETDQTIDQRRILAIPLVGIDWNILNSINKNRLFAELKNVYISDKINNLGEDITLEHIRKNAKNHSKIITEMLSGAEINGITLIMRQYLELSDEATLTAVEIINITNNYLEEKDKIRISKVYSAGRLIVKAFPTMQKPRTTTYKNVTAWRYFLKKKINDDSLF